MSNLGTGKSTDPFVVKLPQGQAVYVADNGLKATIYDSSGNTLIDLDRSGQKVLALILEAIADGRTELLAVSLRTTRNDGPLSKDVSAD